MAFGLDATHQVRTNPARMAAIASIGNDRARTAVELLAFSEACELQWAKRAGAVMHERAIKTLMDCKWEYFAGRIFVQRLVFLVLFLLLEALGDAQLEMCRGCLYTPTVHV